MERKIIDLLDELDDIMAFNNCNDFIYNRFVEIKKEIMDCLPKYVITSDTVEIENGSVEVDYEKLKEWVLWEIEENKICSGDILLDNDLADDIIHNKLTLEDLVLVGSEFGYQIERQYQVLNYEDVLVFVNNTTISILEYVNEDNKFYEYVFYFGDVLKAIAIYNNANDFFDYIMSYCKTYIIDKNDSIDTFKIYIDTFNNKEYQFQGLFNDTMYGLVGMAYTNQLGKED